MVSHLFIKQVWAIIWKDLTSEFRTREMILSMCLFAFLILIIFNFAFGVDFIESSDSVSGILWVAFIFAGLLGLGRAFGAERDRQTLPGLILTPINAWGIYLAKMTGVFIFMTMMEIFTIAIFTILFNFSLTPYLLPLSLILFLGTLGFTTVGTIFSAMAATLNARDVILSILVFPITVPIILASVKATGGILDGGSLADITSWLKILTAFDLIFLLLAYLTFGFILEE